MGNMLGAVVEHVLVDFVRDGDHVPAQAEIADALEFAAREYFTRGIIGRVQHDGLGLGAESCRQIIGIERLNREPAASQNAEWHRIESHRGNNFRRRARTPRLRRPDS